MMNHFYKLYLISKSVNHVIALNHAAEARIGDSADAKSLRIYVLAPVPAMLGSLLDVRNLDTIPG
jgi:hypothetical protein